LQEQRLISALDGLVTEGGGDDAENALGALQRAMTCLEWAGTARYAVLINDRCHGTSFCGTGVRDDDDFTGGGTQLEAVVAGLVANQTELIVCHVNCVSTQQAASDGTLAAHPGYAPGRHLPFEQSVTAAPAAQHGGIHSAIFLDFPLCWSRSLHWQRGLTLAITLRLLAAHSTQTPLTVKVAIRSKFPSRDKGWPKYVDLLLRVGSAADAGETQRSLVAGSQLELADHGPRHVVYMSGMGHDVVTTNEQADLPSAAANLIASEASEETLASLIRRSRGVGAPGDSGRGLPAAPVDAVRRIRIARDVALVLAYLEQNHIVVREVARA
jgi:hypothetical protein